MTTSNTKAPAKRGYVPGHPGEAPDDMTSARAIRLNGNSHSLRVHYADRPNTIVDAEHYISQIPTRDMTGVVYPDLLIAFGADLDALEWSDAYVISEHGKLPTSSWKWHPGALGQPIDEAAEPPEARLAGDPWWMAATNP